MAWNILHNESAHRFELKLDEESFAQLVYMQKNGSLHLVHTEVPPKWEGQGIAAELTRTALEYARQHQLSVVPSCPYVQYYLGKHPGYQSLVSNDFNLDR